MKLIEKTYNPNAPKVGLSHVLKHFWRGLKPQKWYFLLSVLGFGTAVGLQAYLPVFYKKMFDLLGGTVRGEAIATKVIVVLLTILLINFTVWVLYRGTTLIMNRFKPRTMARIKQNSFGYMMHHSYSFFTNNFTGALVQRVGRFSRAFDRAYDILVFDIIPLILYVTIAIIVIYAQQPVIAYGMFVWILIMIILGIVISRWKLEYNIEAAKADSAVTAVLSDAVANQNTVASFSGFDYESDLFKDVTFDHAAIQLKARDFNSIVDAIQAGLMILIEFFVFYYSIRYWQVGVFTVGTFVLIQTYIISLGHRLWNIGRIIRDFYELFADSKEMVEILETPYDIKDLPGAGMLEVKEGKIEFKEMSFSFNETRTVLDKINLEIKGGEKVALIGPSGAGKSTMVKLALRMYDVTEGQILIDGQNVKDVTQDSLRGNISLVPQDPVLFHRSLLENIRYGREEATDEEVVEAARSAHCDEFIDSLPLKYDTFVGERGIKLSGGERQRVAIARAILKNAPILILDEATSSLDSHSESLIQDALDRLMKGKTTIVIAHRLSTIRKMDRVVVIDGGKIIEEGSHEDLLSRDQSLYKNLWNLQAGGFLPG